MYLSSFEGCCGVATLRNLTLNKIPSSTRGMVVATTNTPQETAGIGKHLIKNGFSPMAKSHNGGSGNDITLYVKVLKAAKKPLLLPSAEPAKAKKGSAIKEQAGPVQAEAIIPLLARYITTTVEHAVAAGLGLAPQTVKARRKRSK